MDLLQLRYFCTVAGMLNISHAAAAHNIPQPAMSKTISGLEKELGTPLFSRYKNRLSLTPAGEELYREADQVLSVLDAAVARIRAEARTEIVSLRMLVTALQNRTALLMGDYAARNPDVSLQIFRTANVSREYDLCVSDTPPGPQYDRSQLLLTRQVQLFAAVRKDHPLAKRERMEVAQLKGLPMVCIRPSPVLTAFEQLCRKNGFLPQAAVVCDDFQLLQQYVLSGVGYALTTSYSWLDMNSRDIVHVPLDETVSQAVSLYWPGGHPEERHWLEIRTLLEKELGKDVP